MKLLSGQEIAGFTKERHAQAVRKLRGRKIFPKLAIVKVLDDPVINTYVNLKKRYGEDIGIAVDIYSPSQKDVPNLLKTLNGDKTVHGIIVQLPLEDPSQTEAIVNLIDPSKDVDALGKDSKFEAATPTAILWLLAGNNVDLKDKKVLLIGRGKLVGGPLEKILKHSKVDLDVADKDTANTKELTQNADVIIAAANAPSILTADMVKSGVVIVDAGTANEEGKTVGNAAADLYERDDITITPRKGGVGPLTVCALFENVIRAASNVKN